MELDSFMQSGASNRMEQLKVRLVPERNCWVKLPTALLNRLFDSGVQTPLLLVLRPVGPAGGPFIGTANGGPAPAEWHVAWSGAQSVSSCLEVPAAMAHCLSLPDGITVSVRADLSVPAAVTVTVEPANTDDWEVVEQNAEYLEDQILTQVGVVRVGQPFPFWVRSQMQIILKVSAAVPADLVRLVAGAEVAVAPQPRSRPPLADSRILAPPEAAVDGEEEAGESAQRVVWLRIQAAEGKSLTQAMILPEPTAAPPPPGSPQELETSGGNLWTHSTLAATMSEATALSAGLCQGDSVEVTARNKWKRELHLSVQLSPAAAAGHLLLPDPLWRFQGSAPCTHVRLQRTAKQGLGQKAARDLVHLQSITLSPVAGLHDIEVKQQKGKTRATNNFEAVSNIILPSPEKWRKLLCNWVAIQAGSQKSVLIQDGSIVTLGTKGHAKYKAYSISLRWARGTSIGIQHLPLQINAAGLAASSVVVELGGLAIPAGLSYGARPKAVSAPTAGAEWLQVAALKALRQILPMLAHRSRTAITAAGLPAAGHLLLVGAAGTGKSALALQLSTLVGGAQDVLAHTVWLDCRKLAADIAEADAKKGSNGTEARTQLDSKLAEALEHMPALLVLDDLDVLCPAPAQDPNVMLPPHNEQLLQWLCDIMDALRPPHALPSPVVICATCSEVASLPACLRTPGRLDATVVLPQPGTAGRASMLAAELGARGLSFAPEDLQEIAAKVDGYDAADMRVLLDRAALAAARRNLADISLDNSGRHHSTLPSGAQQTQHSRALQTPPTDVSTAESVSVGVADVETGVPIEMSGENGRRVRITGDDLSTALRGFTPAAYWGVGKLSGGSGVQGWEDVGGMSEVRDALRESLELPTRYAQLVAKAPLRLRTGVLLYGPPGCGKTHIVSAAVAAAGMRFVGVKGPELLNKYIGASEAAVRDIFRRAAAAAPCVLFFDEFDAIAPQRGHDSTGVTDRVVNQLLTELDGVEGLKGVCVIGATSRPDLLDAALLRPGRLDRLLYCGFPTASDRTAILKAGARRLELAPGVEFDGIAAATEGFTGADLAALLSEAQLSAVHSIIDQQSPTEAGQKPGAKAFAMPVITMEDVTGALDRARPSIPAQEAVRLDRTYSQFRDSRDPFASSKHSSEKRATLG